MEDVMKKFESAFVTDTAEIQKLEEEATPKISEELVARAEQLNKLGFTNTPEVNAVNKEYQRTRAAHKTLETIETLKKNYPSNKILSRERFHKVLVDNDLVYGELNKFIGVVPEKNLKNITTFVEKHTSARLQIAGMKNDFDLSDGYDEKTRQVRKKVEDPIVFVEHRTHVVIVDAWGPEAEIPEVFNEIQN